MTDPSTFEQDERARLVLTERNVNGCLTRRPRAWKEEIVGKHLADITLAAEKKMIRELVMGYKALKVFRLEGFRDEGFAKALQEAVC